MKEENLDVKIYSRKSKCMGDEFAYYISLQPPGRRCSHYLLLHHPPRLIIVRHRMYRGLLL